jgi:hypothetical protein
MIRGPVAWAKVLGKPQPGYDKRQLEWSFDVGLDKTSIAKFKELGCADYVKPAVNPKNGKKHVLDMPYAKFTRKEKKFDGSDGKPISVVDNKGKPWPEDKLIGNGSIINVKFAVNEKQSGGMKPSVVAIQVWEYKEYEGGESFPTDEDGEESWAAE